MNLVTFVVLSGAAFRTWRLIAWDVVTRSIRDRVLGTTRSPVVSRNSTLEEYETHRRARLAKFVQCPWCLGSWLSFGWYASWLIEPKATIWIAIPLAMSAVVALMDRD